MTSDAQKISRVSAARDSIIPASHAPEIDEPGNSSFLRTPRERSPLRSATHPANAIARKPSAGRRERAHESAASASAPVDSACDVASGRAARRAAAPAARVHATSSTSAPAPKNGAERPRSTSPSASDHESTPHCSTLRSSSRTRRLRARSARPSTGMPGPITNMDAALGTSSIDLARRSLGAASGSRRVHERERRGCRRRRRARARVAAITASPGFAAPPERSMPCREENCA